MTKHDIQDHIRAMHVQLGRFPKIAEMAVEFNMPQYQVTNMLQRFVQDGFLIRVGNWYRFPPVVTATEEELHTQPTKGTQPAPEQPPPSPVVPPPVDPPDSLTRTIEQFLPILRWAFLAIGAVATVLAAWYNELWFEEYLPAWVSWLTAGIFVGFAIMAFELALWLFVQAIQDRTRWLGGIKWGLVFMSAVIMTLWIIVLGVSITARVAGQYNQWVAEQVTTPQDPKEVARTTELANLQITRKTNQDNVATWQPLLESAAGLVAKAGVDLETKDKWPKTYAQAQADVTKYSGLIIKAQDEVKGLNAREVVLLAAAPTAPTKRDMDDAYSWAAKAMSVPKEQVHFWANVFPAIFLDVIAPVGFTVFFFLGGGKRRNAPTMPPRRTE